MSPLLFWDWVGQKFIDSKTVENSYQGQSHIKPSIIMTSEKPIHTVILDAGPIIRGEPGISSLLQQCEEIVSTPEVIREIRDEATRSRLQTTLLPFLTLKSPNPHSVKVITDFARKTGDLAVLSKVDIHLLALSYEIECEKNGGDWRLRSTPGQKRTNGPSPAKIEAEAAAEKEAAENAEGEVTNLVEPTTEALVTEGGPVRIVGDLSTANPMHLDQPVQAISDSAKNLQETSEPVPIATNPEPAAPESVVTDSTISAATAPESMSESIMPEVTVLASMVPESSIQELPVKAELSKPVVPQSLVVATPEAPQESPLSLPVQELISIPDHATTSIEELSQKVGSIPVSDNTASASEDSESEGWITPSNLKKKQVEDTRHSNSTNTAPAKMQVATITGDYAMQNVLLQMNLNLLSPTLNRIRNIKTFVLRCHACFNIVKDTTKQFCPRCGKPTLTRVSCTTDSNGEFKLHLKKNMQWNHRGDRFSIPKPVAGASNGKVAGGGKNGWGNGLILAEDQKEFVRGNEEGKRLKQRDLMDEDYLPGILTGDRRVGTGKMKVGAGRNINSKKR
jgi:RNA-binding protein NOB1